MLKDWGYNKKRSVKLLISQVMSVNIEDSAKKAELLSQSVGSF